MSKNDGGLVEVYRSTDPNVITRWKNGLDIIRDQTRAVIDFCASVTGFDPAEAKVSAWNYPDGGAQVTGPVFPLHDAEGNEQEIPAGWRRDRKRPDVLVPDKRTGTGRAIARKLDEVSRVSSHLIGLHGMPQHVEVPNPQRGTTVYHYPSVQLVDDTYLEVGWAVPVPRTKVGPEWERIKLSQYYAEIEAKQEAKQEAEEQEAPSCS